MTLNHWFLLASWLVVPAWLLLLAAPRWRWTIPISRYAIPGALAVLYCLVILTRDESAGSLASLDSLALRFGNPDSLLVGWLHYLVIDLFVGTWVLLDSHARRVPRFAVLSCLVLTFFLAPAGLLAYLLLRGLFTPAAKRGTHVEAAELV